MILKNMNSNLTSKKLKENKTQKYKSLSFLIITNYIDILEFIQ